MTDRLGSVRRVVDQAGLLSERRSYGAFGQPRIGTDGVELGFAGELADGSGGIWLRARHYFPALGRFAQRDDYAGTLGWPQSRNRYVYANANPLASLDPSGRAPVLLAVLAVAAVAVSVTTLWAALERRATAPTLETFVPGTEDNARLQVARQHDSLRATAGRVTAWAVGEAVGAGVGLAVGHGLRFAGPSIERWTRGASAWAMRGIVNLTGRVIPASDQVYAMARRIPFPDAAQHYAKHVDHGSTQRFDIWPEGMTREFYERRAPDLIQKPVDPSRGIFGYELPPTHPRAGKLGRRVRWNQRTGEVGDQDPRRVKVWALRDVRGLDGPTGSGARVLGPLPLKQT